MGKWSFWEFKLHIQALQHNLTINVDIFLSLFAKTSITVTWLDVVWSTQPSDKK